MAIIRFHTELNVYRKSFDVAMQMYRLSMIQSRTRNYPQFNFNLLISSSDGKVSYFLTADE